MNKQEYNPLTIIPIDDQNARLTKVVCEDNNSVFISLGLYEGYNVYGTPKRLKINTGEYNGKIYTITEISDCSFSHCRFLEEILLGKNISDIKWNMYQCNSLQNIFVDKLNPVYHDIEGVLFRRNELVAFPQGRKGSYIVPLGTKLIGNHAFKSSHISEIILPEGLEEIGINAFYECNEIEYIVLPESIKKVSPNNNVGNQPITQKFYLSSDKERSHPLSITDILKLFPK